MGERQDTLYTLERKHNVQTVEELIVLKASFARQLEAEQNDCTLLGQLEEKLRLQTGERNRLAATLHIDRAEVLDKLAAVLCARLALLGIPDAQLSFDLNLHPDFGPLGISSLQVFFSANKDMAPRDLSSIAAG